MWVPDGRVTRETAAEVEVFGRRLKLAAGVVAGAAIVVVAALFIAVALGAA
ncbi:MAG TPA: hypothetical protein VD863_06980 [Bradyrhizobium sp.]|nr:hypothetical protein [Bradyrhizobium sp.]